MIISDEYYRKNLKNFFMIFRKIDEINTIRKIKKFITMKKRNYRENFFISDKFSVIYILKEKT